MTRLTWDESPYQTGLDRAVFYTPGGTGTVWNGLSDVTESPSEADSMVQHIDGLAVRKRQKPGELEGTLQAYTIPDSFFDKLFMGERLRNFGLSYRIQTEDSYEIHLIYNILLQPSEQTHSQDEADPFSWNFTTRAIPIPGAKNSAHLTIDAKTCWPSALAAVESILYGDESMDAQLPSPMALADIFEVHSMLRITDNGDGSWTAEVPDDSNIIAMLDSTTFQIDWPSATFISSDEYTIRSW